VTVGHAIWKDQLSPAEQSLLSRGLPSDLDRAPEVLVVGGGIVGLATAAACLSLGSVVVLERETLGAGASGGAAGLLMPEAHVGVDPPFFVEAMRRSLEEWRDLEHRWPGGVGLLALDRRGVAQARVNPLRALARLAAGLPGVATRVSVMSVECHGGRVETVMTNVGEFRPRHVVFATGTPPALLGLDKIPSGEVKGHMLATPPTSFRPADPELATPIEGGRLLMGGTLDLGDHERVVRESVIASMLAELGGGLEAEYRWACFRPAHPDHLPVIDRVPGVDNAWITSGHYKTGILMAPATGAALAQWLKSGSPPEWVNAFTLARDMRASGASAPAT
jgi:glycine/D-amino acid oxidase-like deaminating enzyme